jgi:hypothetical protein
MGEGSSTCLGRGARAAELASEELGPWRPCWKSRLSLTCVRVARAVARFRACLDHRH